MLKLESMWSLLIRRCLINPSINFSSWTGCQPITGITHKQIHSFTLTYKVLSKCYWFYFSWSAWLWTVGENRTTLICQACHIRYSWWRKHFISSYAENRRSSFYTDVASPSFILDIFGLVDYLEREQEMRGGGLHNTWCLYLLFVEKNKESKSRFWVWSVLPKLC